MEFILPFHIEPSRHKISHDQKILFIGSCFTEEVGNHFKNLKFDVLQNPNGILFDPRSITYALNSYIENKQYHEEDLFFQNELWNSWQHHSQYSGLDKIPVLDKINESQAIAQGFVKNASWLIITLGTAYAYQLTGNNNFVANCHKVPSSSFQKKLLAIESMYDRLDYVISRLAVLNPNLKIVLTVSPVRHVKDGLVANNISKARLLEVVHHLKTSHKQVTYFPAYELVIDVLRDYRFYKQDLVHPNEMAIDYVFDIFCKTYMTEDTEVLMGKIKSLHAAIRHRPFHENSESYQAFKKEQLNKAAHIQNANPHLDLSQEINYFTEP